MVGQENSVQSLARLESLDQIVLMSVTVTMEPLATQWMESVSASLAMQATGVKTTALKGTSEKDVTNHVNVNLKIISVIQHVAVFVNQDMEATTVQLPSPAWQCTQSHPVQMMVILV